MATPRFPHESSDFKLIGALDLRTADGERLVLEVVVGDDRVGLSMSECFDRCEHTLTPAERARVAKGDTYRIPKYDYFPGGRLRLQVHDERLARGSWADTEKRRLERALGHVVVSVEAVAADRRQRRVEEEQKRLAAEQRRQREEEERARIKREQRQLEYRELSRRSCAAWRSTGRSRAGSGSS
jgi:hypothetical protein